MPNRTRDTPYQAVKVAVVGHTNTGKTSLIRTLLRDDRFGEIEDAAGTTRYVEKTAIFAGDEEALTLFDTPGFEDSSALLQALEELGKTTEVKS
ncbi:MAG: GTPase domain-containing protein, partial [Pseudomonadales bacterium]